jgi:hypothetical protein
MQLKFLFKKKVKCGGKGDVTTETKKSRQC